MSRDFWEAPYIDEPWAPPAPSTSEAALKRMYFEAWKDAEQQVEDWKHRAREAAAKLYRLRHVLDDNVDPFED